ncbi:winged helix-turn-helix domain-containing protein [Ottowia caeni]
MPTTLGDLLQIRWQALRADKPAQAANRALYDCLRESILDGSLPAGTQLPPTRELAVVLDLSRNTTTHAYNQLLAEGYVRSLTGSGTYVNDVLPEQVLWTHPQRKFEAVRGAPDPLVRLSLRGSTLLENAQASSVQWGLSCRACRMSPSFRTASFSSWLHDGEGGFRHSG